jgi:hypothetical protein
LTGDFVGVLVPPITLLVCPPAIAFVIDDVLKGFIANERIKDNISVDPE